MKCRNYHENRKEKNKENEEQLAICLHLNHKYIKMFVYVCAFMVSSSVKRLQVEKKMDEKT